LFVNKLLGHMTKAAGIKVFLIPKQGDHLYEKSGNVMTFDSCQSNVRNFTKIQGSIGGKYLGREKLHKTVYCKLHICIYS